MTPPDTTAPADPADITDTVSELPAIADEPPAQETKPSNKSKKAQAPRAEAPKAEVPKPLTQLEVLEKFFSKNLPPDMVVAAESEPTPRLQVTREGCVDLVVTDRGGELSASIYAFIKPDLHGLLIDALRKSPIPVAIGTSHLRPQGR